MISPFTRGKAVLEKEWTNHSFRKDDFRILEHRYRCLDTDQSFFTEGLNQLNLSQIHNLYRSRHQVPFPEEIKKIREQYGLSASKMSELLGFGINSYRQYEQGEMPSQANAKLIRLAARPDRFIEFLEEKVTLFSAPQLDKIRDRIKEMKQKEQLSPIMNYLWNYHLDANEFTGFVKPTFEKVAGFVLFFVEQCRPLKTRLNKLLFYADFLHFKKTGYSISGCSYRAIPYGPVPSHFHELFGLLQDQGYIRIEEELFPSGHIGERFDPTSTLKQEVFLPEELETMKGVVQHFQDLRTKDLIEISHMEEAWKANISARKLISYQAHGFNLTGL